MEDNLEEGDHPAAINFGIHDEMQLALYFALFLVLILIALLASNKIAHHFHWHFLPEAAVVILIGIVASLFCRLEGSIVAISLMVFDPKTFFVVLLPPIIFNSGYMMKRRFFFENLRAILIYAVVGTLLSNFFVGSLLYVVGRAGLSVELSLAECLTFGALISATDPVSTLAVFQELHVDPTLFYIVFGESVLNDAVAIVLFTTFSKFVGHEYTFHRAGMAVLSFILNSIGSTMVGILFGIIAALLFKHFDFKNCTKHEIGAYVLFAYLPFLASAIIGISGVVSVLFAGITMKHYASNNLSREAQEMCSSLFEILAHMTETTVFLNLGLCVLSLTTGFDYRLILWTFLFIFAGRAINIYPLSALLNCSKTFKISSSQQHMLWFSGLRGAVAFALATDFPGDNKKEIIATTMLVVLVTVFFMGGGTVAMLRRLQIQQLTPEEERQLDRTVRPVDRMAILKFDAKYLTPFFTKELVSRQSIRPSERSDNIISSITSECMIHSTSYFHEDDVIPEANPYIM